jgi:hypothetical protein
MTEATAPQSTPESEPGQDRQPRPHRARRYGLAAGALVATAAMIAAPFVLRDKGDGKVEARDAPVASAPGTANPNALALPSSPAESKPAPSPTDIKVVPIKPETAPQTLEQIKENLKANAAKTAGSVLNDMKLPGSHMTNEGYDNLSIGNYSDDIGPGTPRLLAVLDKGKNPLYPGKNVIKVRAQYGVSRGDADPQNPNATSVDLDFAVSANNPIMGKQGKLGPDDFAAAVSATDTSFLAATAQAGGNWVSVDMSDPGRFKVTDPTDLNNNYLIDDPVKANTVAQDLNTTMATAANNLHGVLAA